MANNKDTKKNLVFKNRKAFHDFTILETLEAGIVLEGSEVKAIREGRINLKDSFVRITTVFCTEDLISDSRRTLNEELLTKGTSTLSVNNTVVIAGSR